MNIRVGNVLVKDPDGGIFSDLNAARQEALLSVREMVAAMIRSNKAIDGQCIEITTEDGTVQETVRLRDVIRFA